MKVHTTTLDVERSSVSTDSHFVIKATSKAFDILSSGLYSDKIQAVVRELSCNAYDSHVAAGKPTEPIVVCLPTLIDPTFYVQDFGIGLHDFDVRGYWYNPETHEKMDLDKLDPAVHNRDEWVLHRGVYNTYFESLKTSSNDFIGQLGLGSKSPYSYTATFLVESVFNGVKSVYTCYKDEFNMPAITRMSYEDTDEVNGVRVTMSVRSVDIDKFHVAARRALMYFVPTPQVVGAVDVRPHAVEHVIHGTKWKVRSPSVPIKGAHVVQGFVSYPVDRDQVAQHQALPPIVTRLLNTNIDLYVDIGLVEVAASREALSYDKRTINNVSNALSAAASELHASFQRQYDQCTTQWEMVKQQYQLANASDGLGSIYAIVSDESPTPFSWAGGKVSDSITINATQLGVRRMITAEMKQQRARRGRKRLTQTVSWVERGEDGSSLFDIRYTPSVLILVNDIPDATETKLGKLIKRVMEDHDTARAHMVEARGRDITTEIKAHIGDAPVVCLSSVTLKRSTGVQRSGTRGVKRSTEAYVFTNFPQDTSTWYRNHNKVRRTFSVLTWDRCSVDPSAGGVYVLRDGYRATTKSGGNILHLDDVIKIAKGLGLVDQATRVVGLRKSEVDEYTKNGYQWVELYQLIGERLDQRGADAVSTGPALHALNSATNNFYEDLLSDWSQWRDRVADGKFKQYVDGLHVLSCAQEADVSTDDINNLLSHLGQTSKLAAFTQDRAAKLIREHEIMVGHYPMLTYVIDNPNTKGGLPKPYTFGYVNLVEGKGCHPLQLQV